MSARCSFSPSLAGAVLLAFAVAAPAAAGERASVPGSSDAVVAAVEPSAGVLRRLPSIGRATRLAGERDHAVWPVFLTAAEVTARPHLRLVLTAAVSVMPEASSLTVFVDDRPVGGAPIATGGVATTVDLALPEGGLHAGWNALRVEVEQRHRVECSLASTYELWTEIDRARSGLVFDDGFRPDRRGLADLADLAPDDGGRVRLRLVSAQDLDPARLSRALRLAQAVALAGGFLDPVVAVTRRPGEGPGVDLLLDRGARTGVAGVEGLAPDVVGLDAAADPDRMTVAVPEDPAALERLIADLEAVAARPQGSQAGRLARAALAGLPVEGDRAIGFAELGVVTTEFSGRLFHTAFDVRLPADFYAADYGAAILKLAGAYAPGLDRDARLSVLVDGRRVAGAPLGARDGETFTDRRIAVPLSAFRPGRNRIEIEAALPEASDRVCDPTAAIDVPQRLLLTDRSEIVFPTLARSAHMPDLAATGAGVLAELGDALRPKVWMPRPDADAMSALATIETRIAVASDRIGVPEIAFRAPPADAPSAWVIGAFADLPAAALGAAGLEPGAVREAWSRRSPAPARLSAADAARDPLASRVETMRLAALDTLAAGYDPIATGTVRFAPVAAENAADGGDRLDRWRRAMESPWSLAALGRNLRMRIDRAFGSSAAGDDVPPVSPRATTGLLFSQALSPAGGVWTLTTAASNGALAEGAEVLTEAERWEKLGGDAAAWNRVDDRIETSSIKPRGLFAVGPSLGNLRLVAAGWVGEHPIVFAAFALVAAIFLGFTTSRLLARVGERR